MYGSDREDLENMRNKIKESTVEEFWKWCIEMQFTHTSSEGRRLYYQLGETSDYRIKKERPRKS